MAQSQAFHSGMGSISPVCGHDHINYVSLLPKPGDLVWCVKCDKMVQIPKNREARPYVRKAKADV